MKRTAKWHKHLKIKELRHLKGNLPHMTLKDFVLTRASQAALSRPNDEPCWTCRLIESKLKEAGVL